MAKNKQRLDKILVDRGLVESRHKAQALIMAGQVKVEGVVQLKSGFMVAEECQVDVTQVESYVSRGGQKIAPVFSEFGIEVKDKVALDIGASTGGFTQALLNSGASLVYAVDSGHNQLDYRLREDPRVIVMEDTNARYLSKDDFSQQPSICTIDVSFISLRKILKPVIEVMADYFQIAALVKPQFELGRELVSKGGVVRDEKLQMQAVDLVKQYCDEIDIKADKVLPSPIRGYKKGNQEYFLYIHNAQSS